MNPRDEISDWYHGNREIPGLDVKDTSNGDLILTGNGGDTILLGFGSDRVLSAGGDDIVQLQGGANVVKSDLFVLGNAEGFTDEIQMTISLDGNEVVDKVFENQFSNANGALAGGSFGELEIEVVRGIADDALNLYSLELNGIDVDLLAAIIDRSGVIENYLDSSFKCNG